MIASKSDSLPELPPDSKPLSHQVAGHFYGRSKTKLGLLQRISTGDVLKPLLNPPRGPREHQFYQLMFSDRVSEQLRALRPFLPNFLGSYEYGGMTYLILENLLQTFRYPCVMDVKLGRITYDQEATPEEAQRRILKFQPATEIGFQLLGWKTYRSKEKFCLSHDKVCGRSLSKEELIHALAHFFGAPEYDHRSLVRLVLQQLRALYEVMSKQYQYTFIASSLLITYDDENRSEEFCPTKVVVRLVDFAHVFPSNKSDEPDENFLFGLRYFIIYCQQLLEEDFIYNPLEKFDHHSIQSLGTCRKEYL